MISSAGKGSDIWDDKSWEEKDVVFLIKGIQRCGLISVML